MKVAFTLKGILLPHKKNVSHKVNKILCIYCFELHVCFKHSVIYIKYTSIQLSLPQVEVSSDFSWTQTTRNTPSVLQLTMTVSQTVQAGNILQLIKTTPTRALKTKQQKTRGPIGPNRSPESKSIILRKSHQTPMAESII